MPQRRNVLGAFFRLLWKRGFFITVLLILAGLGVAFRYAINYTENHAQRLAELQESLNKVDFSKDPALWMQVQRKLEIVRIEPALRGLMVLMLIAFGAVLIITAIRCALDRPTFSQSSDQWLPKMREKREAFIRSQENRK
jgi:hypothetical protein